MAKCLTVAMIFFISLFLCVIQSSESETSKAGVYIIYMGASPSDDSTNSDHVELLSSMLKRSGKTPIHRYRHGFSGFAAHLSEEEVSSIAKQPGVVSVFPDQMLQLHTTHSWDFLMHQAHLTVDNDLDSDSNLDSTSEATDTIIGFLDTGIWPESKSFDDKCMGPVPTKWKGTCMRGKKGTGSFNCNRKIIGARSYNGLDDENTDYDTPRDSFGHGTHVAATAAGGFVPGASFYGLANGTMRGGSPKSRIAVYKVCSSDGCSGSKILAGFDDAIGDGVDVLSLSMGSLSGEDFFEDPLAIGAFHAMEKGITVVCSAGNFGPDTDTVVNVAPWIITVGASTIDRHFESDILLQGKKTILIKGGGIHFAKAKKSQGHQLIYAKLAKKKSASELAARNCMPNTMEENIIKGKIVVCDNMQSWYTVEEKIEEIKKLGGTGLVLIDDKSRQAPDTYGSFPVTVITSKDGAHIMSYINSTRKPFATITPTRSHMGYKPAPAIAYFSSRGPSLIAGNILKPDVVAPGVNILAAWKGGDKEAAPEGKPPPLFNLLSGTSMACPHVAGIAAVVKSRNPAWSPAAIRSAIMTTAVQTNNLRAPITTETGFKATPYDFGAGEVSASGPFQPGLIFETSHHDYLNFLCYLGYDASKIKMVSKYIPGGFACPTDATVEKISNINYPSITISNFNRKEPKKVSRTVTNVARDGETVYTVSINAPKWLNVKVIPARLHFMKNIRKLSYQVIFSSAKSLPQKDAFGSITWSNGQYVVRSPFVVTQ